MTIQRWVDRALTALIVAVALTYAFLLVQNLRDRQAVKQADYAIADPEYVVVAADVKRLANAAEVVLVDLDDRDTFTAGHLPGAINLPINEIETRADMELSQAAMIVLYCRCANMGASKQGRDLLISSGFRADRLFVLKGKMSEWKALGFQS